MAEVESPVAAAHEAATVMLLRDAPAGLEALYVRRSSALAFHGGAWVYPGGRVDAADFGAAVDDCDAAARRAAVREAWEETSLRVAPEDLIPVAEWTTPVVVPQRFRTWFFAAKAASGAVRVDGAEIDAYRWMTPSDALSGQRSGEIDLPPPIFVTSEWLTRYGTADAALRGFAGRPPPRYLPRNQTVAGGRISLLPEDVAFESGDLSRTGRYHRIWLLGGELRYERSADIEV